MKITFVMAGGFDLSGGDRVIATYAQNLQKRGHEVFIVTSKPQPLSWRQRLRSLRQGKGWQPRDAAQPSHFDALDIPLKRLDRYRPVDDADLPDADVVIATWWETAEWVARFSPAKGAKAYFVQHHEVFDYLPQERARATYRLPLHKIVVAQWLADVMRTQYEDSQVSLVPNSVDITQFTAPPRNKQATPTVGMLYSLVPWKGCEMSLNAFSIAAQRVPGLRLVAFGAEPPSPGLPLPPTAIYVQKPDQALL
ncbi:MAG TPA: glycosyltransferase family 4 protein, partial [Allocoleopsis sp.]